MPEISETPASDEPSDPPKRTPRRRPFNGRLAAIYACGALVIVLALALVLSFTGTNDTTSASPKTGAISLDARPGDFTATTLPNAGLVDMSGQVTDLQSIAKGQPTIINLFSQSCVACRKEMPALEKLHQQLGDRAQLVGLNVGDSHDVTAAFVKQMGVTYTVVRDPTLLIPNRLNVTTQPLTLWVDAKGNIVGHQYGSMTSAEMRSGVEKYFGIDPAPA